MNLIESQVRLKEAYRYGDSVVLPGQRVVPRSWPALKRLTDVTVALLGLALASPLIAVAALAVLVVSHGSPFFAQERVGLMGRRFKMYKLRSMVAGAHLMHEDLLHLSEVTGPVLKIKRDPRLHAFGAFLRRTSIDELPNFINVLLGDMSVVGPRPPLPFEVEHYDERALRRLTVKPGVTCLWQISGRSNISFDEWMDLDNDYIDSWTPAGDLALIARTIPAVLLGNGAH